MSNFDIHTKETAQTESAELLGNAEKASAKLDLAGPSIAGLNIASCDK